MDKFNEMSLKIIRDLIKDVNCVDWQAAGVVGNFAAETGKFKIYQEIRPTVAGSKGGYGWAQWTGPRRRAFETWAKSQGLSVDSYEGNYGFLLYELKGAENAALKALYKTKTAAEAAEVFMKKYERPGIPALKKRIQYAEEALKVYRNAPIEKKVPPVAEQKPKTFWEKIIEFITNLFKGK